MATVQSFDTYDLPAPTFELETYIANYEGGLVPIRLSLIAICCPPLRRAALNLGLATVRYGKDVQQYERLGQIGQNLGEHDLAKPDTDWMTRTEANNRRELTRLEGELRSYKNNMIRESVRMGQDDVAAHHLATGGPRVDAGNPGGISGLNAAMQSYNKMRDYCHTPSQVNAMTMRLIFTAVLQAATAEQVSMPAGGHYSTIHSHAVRLRSSGVKEEEQVQLNSISYVAEGIAHLGNSQYAEAADYFLRASFDYHRMGAVHGIDFEKNVVSANDVAIYAGLCALATMSRDDLNNKVLSGSFRPFLELEPHIRKAIVQYVTGNYGQCISLLMHYRADWTVDLWLNRHVIALFTLIRQRSIVAYFGSFSQVKVSALAKTFATPTLPQKTSEDAMTEELLSLIKRGELDARLDIVDGMLFAPSRDIWRETHETAKIEAADVERQLLRNLHRVNCNLANIVIRRESRAVR